IFLFLYYTSDYTCISLLHLRFLFSHPTLLPSLLDFLNMGREISCCVYPTLVGVGNPLSPIHDGDRGFAGHKLMLIKSLSFVHTSHHYCQLDGLVRSSNHPKPGQPRPF
uniref:Uncharacterized protein n=1 Tax=Anas zonorhyncha TaxID=75864 RepID=A0A8B9UL38_9AVES